MSKSIHMTINQVVRESGYDYGSKEFKDYVFENNIELLAQKRNYKKAVENKRLESEFQRKNGLK